MSTKRITGIGEPIHVHDCKKCIFLGRYEEHDLYFCPPAQGAEPTGVNCTVVARYGSEGHEYASGVLIAEGLEQSGRVTAANVDPSIRALRVAYLIARDMGWIRNNTLSLQKDEVRQTLWWFSDHLDRMESKGDSRAREVWMGRGKRLVEKLEKFLGVKYTEA